MSLSVTYSLKMNLTSSLSKKVVFNFGDALISTGGMVSFGPPVGDAFLAQFIIEKKRKMYIQYFKINFIYINLFAK